LHAFARSPQPTQIGLTLSYAADTLKGASRTKALSHGQVEGKTRRGPSGVDRTHSPCDYRAGVEPGAKLPEDTIGERFGASRTIVRKGWVSLRLKGSELRRNRGAAVATPAWEEARDTFDVRLGIEHLVMSRLAGRLSKEQIKTLEAHVDQEEHARGKQ
jgi:hypothetical protein